MIQYDILCCPRKEICSGLRHTCTYTNIVDIKRHTHIISHTPFEQTQYTQVHTWRPIAQPSWPTLKKVHFITFDYISFHVNVKKLNGHR